MNLLPNEVMLIIINYLDFRSIARLSQTYYDMYILCNFNKDFSTTKDIANTFKNGSFIELFDEHIYLHKHALRLYNAILTRSHYVIEYFICDLNENTLISLIFLLSKTESYHTISYIANKYGYLFIMSDNMHISCNRGLLYTSCIAVAKRYQNIALYKQLVYNTNINEKIDFI